MAMKIDPTLCTSCGDCEPQCPTEAISPKKGVYAINPDLCNECEGEHDLPQCIATCMEDGCITPIEA
ncbi:4Fe-4S binding protein [Rhodobacter maris]|uniref:4Fe-4S binding protein n=1 Tax=Rhodobacter maris TaxID=446682 RepID=A0A285SIT1_9RHOB|nr:4Fe-4S binding protein [Rhodobacter maris]SOC07852.1 4Fe-4S binding protein [Rhodobacter maris]